MGFWPVSEPQAGSANRIPAVVPRSAPEFVRRLCSATSVSRAARWKRLDNWKQRAPPTYRQQAVEDSVDQPGSRVRTDDKTWKAILAEAIEHIGETKCWVSASRAGVGAGKDSARTRRLQLRADAIGVLETDFSAPRRKAVWDLVTRPEKSPPLAGNSDSVVENTANGRRVAGTQNHCMHGKDAIIEDILAWRSFDPHNPDHPAAGSRGRSQDPACPMRSADWRTAARIFEVCRLRQTETYDLPCFDTAYGRTCKASLPGNSEILRALLAEQAKLQGRQRTRGGRLCPFHTNALRTQRSFPRALGGGSAQLIRVNFTHSPRQCDDRSLRAVGHKRGGVSFSPTATFALGANRS